MAAPPSADCVRSQYKHKVMHVGSSCCLRYGATFLVFSLLQAAVVAPYEAMASELTKERRERRQIFILTLLYDGLGALLTTSLPLLLDIGLRWLPKVCSCSSLDFVMFCSKGRALSALLPCFLPKGGISFSWFIRNLCVFVRTCALAAGTLAGRLLAAAEHDGVLRRAEQPHPLRRAWAGLRRGDRLHQPPGGLPGRGKGAHHPGEHPGHGRRKKLHWLPGGARCL